tara:strand:- start:193 stop:417 length:225 start_codon:yes stop_codon:yes gene_type:complete
LQEFKVLFLEALREAEVQGSHKAKQVWEISPFFPLSPFFVNIAEGGYISLEEIREYCSYVTVSFIRRKESVYRC